MGNALSLDLRESRLAFEDATSEGDSRQTVRDGESAASQGASATPAATEGGYHAARMTISGGIFNNISGNQINQTYFTLPAGYDGIPTTAFKLDDHTGTLAEAWRKEMLEWLSITNFRAMFQENIAKRVPETCKEFINGRMFKCWLLREYGILWGTGIPGAGKTVLASIVIEYLQRTYCASTEVNPPRRKTLICFAYCRYTDPIPVCEVLAGLVRQALERHPDTIGIVEKAFVQHRRENTKPSQQELLEFLVAIAKAFEVSFFIVDGLDEALDDIKYELLSTLSSLNVHLFITSRPLQHLEELVPQAEHFLVRASEEDINRLISRKIESSPQLKGLLKVNSLKEELIRTVQARAGGMFLHASLQMESLSRCVSPADVRRTLSQTPRSIEGMYEKTLQRILAAPEPRGELGLRVLQWVVFARRPLSLSDLQYALANCPRTGTFDPDTIIPEETLLSLAKGLVVVENKTIFKRPTGVSTPKLSRVLVPHVRLIHYTAKDALTCLLLEHNPSAHALLASICLARLKSCNFPQSQFSNTDAFVRTFKDTPLLRYAYLDLAYHIEACRTNIPAAEQFVLSCTSFPVILEEHLDLLSPIHTACLYGLHNTVLKLAADNHDYNAGTVNRGLTPLMVAIVGHARAAHPTYPDTAFALLKLPTVGLNSKDRNGKTALMWAARLGQTEVVEEFLKNPNVDVNCVDEEGRSAFLHAAQGGHLPVIQTFLARRDRIDLTLADTSEIPRHTIRTIMSIS